MTRITFLRRVAIGYIILAAAVALALGYGHYVGLDFGISSGLTLVLVVLLSGAAVILMLLVEAVEMLARLISQKEPADDLSGQQL